MRAFLENLTMKEVKALETLANYDCMHLNCQDCPFYYLKTNNITGCLALLCNQLLREYDNLAKEV